MPDVGRHAFARRGQFHALPRFRLFLRLTPLFLSQLLSLHPLTLEDILQQEPREKLEVFDALDYYLISFRALDESYFRYTDDGATGTAADTSGLRGRRKGRGKVEIVEDRPGKEGLEGVGVGGISLYIVVMRDGVVSVSLWIERG